MHRLCILICFDTIGAPACLDMPRGMQASMLYSVQCAKGTALLDGALNGCGIFLLGLRTVQELRCSSCAVLLVFAGRARRMMTLYMGNDLKGA